MRRLHVIDNYDRMGGEIYYREHEKYAHDPELREAYEAGYHCGRKEAYKELSGEQYGERRTYPPMMREHDGIIRYRENEDWDDPYQERRRRDSRGRYM